jgi:hypothetical protein
VNRIHHFTLHNIPHEGCLLLQKRLLILTLPVLDFFFDINEFQNFKLDCSRIFLLPSECVHTVE